MKRKAAVKTVVKSFHVPRSIDAIISMLEERGVANNFSEALRAALMYSMPELVRIAEAAERLSPGSQHHEPRTARIPAYIESFYSRLVDEGVFMSISEAFRFALLLYTMRLLKAVDEGRAPRVALR